MRFVILIVIMVVAVMAGFLALNLAGGNKQNTTASTPVSVSGDASAVDVLVARNFIPVGTVITEQMVEKQPWPKKLVYDNFVVGDTPRANIIGSVARSDFQAKEPLSYNKIARVTDANFLAAGLTTGMRAVTLTTDAVSSVAGYIFPGDRVDVILTHNVPQTLMDEPSIPFKGDKPKVSEAMIANVRVIAVGIRNPASAQQLEQQKSANVTPKAPTSITLEVTPEDAQRVRLAEKNGTLTLALRPLKDREDQTIAGPTVLPSVSRLTPFLEQMATVSGQPVIVVHGTKVDKPEKGGPQQFKSSSFSSLPGSDAGYALPPEGVVDGGQSAESPVRVIQGMEPDAAAQDPNGQVQ